MKSSSKEKSSWNGFRWFIAKSTTGKVSFMFTLGPLDHQVPSVSMPARFARWESMNPGRCWCIGSVSQLRNTGLRKHGSYIGAYHNFPFILSKRETVSLHWNANKFCLGREGRPYYHGVFSGMEKFSIILVRKQIWSLTKVVYCSVPHPPILEKVIQEIQAHQGDYLPVFPISKVCINAWIYLNI